MAQNRSSAVMQQRAEPHDSLDFFPTPPWATRAFCEWLQTQSGSSLRCFDVWEPACGEGHMARPLSEYFAWARASDVHDYGFGEVEDFLWFNPSDRADWIVTNPPFRLAEQFATTALRRARLGVALLVRLAFLEGVERHAKLFTKDPPTDILQFVERVAMVKGAVDPNASSATAYCWLVWRRDAPVATRFHWLAPCRKRLERASDYPEKAA